MNLTREISEAPKLERSFLVLEKDEEEFYRSETGITDLDELKEHILAIQEEAYKVLNSVTCLFVEGPLTTIVGFPVQLH
jgi:hypothetical protein